MLPSFPVVCGWFWFLYTNACPAAGHLLYWTGRVEMSCHRTPRSVVAYASQMLSKSTPESSPSFTDVDIGASAAGYRVHKIFRHFPKWSRLVKVLLRPRISLSGLMNSQVRHWGRWHAWDPNCSVEDLLVACTSMSFRLRSRLYATKGGCLAFADLLIKCEAFAKHTQQQRSWVSCGTIFQHFAAFYKRIQLTAQLEIYVGCVGVIEKCGDK